jgi:hypothetical protein
LHNDPWSAARVPDSGDACDIWDYFRNAVGDLSPLAEPYFTTTAARDTALTAWVAAGNTIRDGQMRCYVQGVGAQRYVSGGWVSGVTKGSLTPTSGWGSGYGNYYAPGYHLTSDGKVTLRGMVQRTGANIVFNGTSGSPTTFLTLPAAIKPASDIAPEAYFGSAASVQTVAARLYCAGGTTALQVTPMDPGTYTVYTTAGFVNLDGVSWYL